MALEKTLKTILADLAQNELTQLCFASIEKNPPDWNREWKWIRASQTLEVQGDVSAVAVLPNGQVVSSGGDNTLKVWDVQSGQCLKTLEGHTREVQAVAVLPNGQIVSGSGDDTLKVWDVESGQCLKTLQGHKGCFHAVAVLPNGQVVSGSYGKILTVWDIQSGQCLKTLKGHKDVVRAVAVLPNGQVVSGSMDQTLKVWDVKSKKCLKTLRHTHPVLAVAVLPNGQIVSGSMDRTLKVWDVKSWKCLRTIDWGTTVHAVAVHPSGQVVGGGMGAGMSESDDYPLQVWDVQIGHCFRILEGHAYDISAVAILPSGQVISGSRDKTLKVWEISDVSAVTAWEQKALLQAVLTNTSLQSLNLSKISLKDIPQGFALLYQIVQTHPTLCTLDLSNTGLTDTHLNDLLPLLYQTQRIKNMAIEGNSLSKAASLKLQQYFDNRLSLPISPALELQKQPTPAKKILLPAVNPATPQTKDQPLMALETTLETTLSALAQNHLTQLLFADIKKKNQGEFINSQTLCGHTDYVNAVAALPSGRVVSGSYDNTLKVWDVQSGQCLKTLQGHTNAVMAIAVLPSGQVVSGSGDDSLKVWDVQSGQCLKTLRGHMGYVFAVAALPSGQMVSGSYDNTLKVWDVQSGQCLKTLQGHTDIVRVVAVLPNGWVVSGSHDNTLKVWDVQSGQCLRTLQGHTGEVWAVAVLPSGQMVSGSVDKTLKVWDVQSGQCLKTLQGHTGFVFAVAALPSGQMVSGSDDNTLKVWDVQSGQCLKTLQRHTGRVWAITVLPSGQVVSGSSDNTLKVWKISAVLALTAQEQEVLLQAVLINTSLQSLNLSNISLKDISQGFALLHQIVQTHPTLYTLDLSRTGLTDTHLNDLLPLLYQTRRIKNMAIEGNPLSQAASLKLQQYFDNRLSLPISPALELQKQPSPTKKILLPAVNPVVSQTKDQPLMAFETTLETTLSALAQNHLTQLLFADINKKNQGEFINSQTLCGHTDYVNAVAALPSGQVVSGSQNNTLKVWDVQNGQCLKTLQGHMDIVWAVAALSNGQVVSGSFDKTLKVWDVQSGQCLKTLRGHMDTVCAVAELPGGQMVSGSVDNTLKVWDVQSGQCLKTLEGHTDSIFAVVVLPNGQVVSGSEDKTLKVWDVQSGQCLKTLQGHVQTVAALPNGQMVSGSGGDDTLKVWDVQSGQCVKTLEGHMSYVNAVAVLPSGQVVSGSDDNTLKVWDVQSGQCLKTFQGHTNAVRAVTSLSSGQVVSGSMDNTLKVWEISVVLALMAQEQEMLLQAVLTNTSLQSLNLSNISLKDIPQGFALLHQIVQTHPTLCTLDLSNTGLTDTDLNDLLPLLYQTKRIQNMAIGGNSLNQAASLKLQQYFDNRLSLPISPVLELQKQPSPAKKILLPAVNSATQTHTKDQPIIALETTLSALAQNHLTQLLFAEIKKKNQGKFINSQTLRNYAEAVAVLPNGQVVSGSADKTLKVWDVQSGQCLKTLQGHTNYVKTVVALPSGQVVSGSVDKTLKIWDVQSGQCLKTLQGHTGIVRTVAMLSNGQVVSGSEDRTLKVWDVQNGQCLKILEGHTNSVFAVVVLPNGQVVSGSADKTLKVWDVQSGQCLKTLRGHASYVEAIAVLPSGQIVSGSDDKTLKVWDVQSGQCFKTLEEHTDSVSAVVVLPNGQVVSGSADKTLKVWDVQSGQCLQTLKEHTNYIVVVAVLPSGQVVSGSLDATLKVWEIPSILTLTLQEQKALLQAVLTNTSLQSLNLSNISLKDIPQGFALLHQIVQTHPTLCALDLSNTGLTDTHLNDLLPLLYQTQRIKNIAIEGNPLSQAASLELQQYFDNCLSLPISPALELEKRSSPTKKILLSAVNPATKTHTTGLMDAHLNSLPLPTLYNTPQIKKIAIGGNPLSQTASLPKPQKKPSSTKMRSSSTDCQPKRLCSIKKTLLLPAGPTPDAPKSQLTAELAVQPLLPLQHIAWNTLKLGKLLGHGGYGDVYQGQWQGVPVAIKQLHAQTLSAALSADFEREAKIMAQCQFPHVVRLYGVCLEAEHTAMVMEYMPKGSLYQVLQDKNEPLPWEPVRWTIAIDIGKGLAYLHHQRKIVHRDLKSLNVLLDNYYQAKISDFGLSKIKLESSQATAQHSFSVVGTLRWLALELAHDWIVGKSLNHTFVSDVYSYGMILWEIVSRQIPYAMVESQHTIPHAIIKGKEKIPDDCPRGFKRVIEACWADSTERKDAETLVTMLEDGLTSKEPLPTPSLLASEDFLKEYKRLVEVENFSFTIKRSAGEALQIAFTGENHIMLDDAELCRALEGLLTCLEKDLNAQGMTTLKFTPNWTEKSLSITGDSAILHQVAPWLASMGMVDEKHRYSATSSFFKSSSIKATTSVHEESEVVSPRGCTMQ